MRFDHLVMTQSHHTPGPCTGCLRAVHGLFLTKIVRPITGSERAPCGAVRILPPRTGPVDCNACIISLRAPYGFRYYKQPVRGPVRGPYGPRTAKYDARVGFLPIMVVSIPLRVSKGAVRHPCGSRTDPYGSRRIRKHCSFPCGVCTGIVRGTRGVQPIQSNP